MDSPAPFECPACGSQIPFKNSWMLTKFSEITCESCSTKLKPIEKTVPRFHAFSGLIAGVIGYIFYREIGLKVAFIVVPIVLLLNCFFTAKMVRFEKAGSQ